MEPRAVSESRSVLAQWMGPSDANPAGFVHGGTVMKLCDEAAAAARSATRARASSPPPWTA
jgi:acyl-CoA hydrolase